MRRFKFQGKKGLAKPFARLMARAADFPEQPELVTFVPLSKNHRRERGYNQSGALAEELGRLLNLPVKPVLEKVKENKIQHLLSAKERRQNVRNVYRASSEVHGKKVLLVDDIVTTGATLRECAGQLYRAGAEKVFALCAADAGAWRRHRQTGRDRRKNRMADRFAREALLIGQEGVEKLRRARVAVFGAGGVGGYAIEALARSGIGAGPD